jgi:hypothetical protein
MVTRPAGPQVGCHCHLSKYPRELWLCEANADISAYVTCDSCSWCLLLLVTMQRRTCSALYCLRLPHQVQLHVDPAHLPPTGSSLKTESIEAGSCQRIGSEEEFAADQRPPQASLRAQYLAAALQLMMVLEYLLKNGFSSFLKAQRHVLGGRPNTNLLSYAV